MHLRVLGEGRICIKFPDYHSLKLVELQEFLKIYNKFLNVSFFVYLSKFLKLRIYSDIFRRLQIIRRENFISTVTHNCGIKVIFSFYVDILSKLKINEQSVHIHKH